MNSNAATTDKTGQLLLRVLVFTLIISVMNGTMFNVVLPVISKEFELTASQVTWIVSGYLIVYAIGTVTYGKLSDKFSIKALITFGLLLLAAGSIVGVVATQYWMIIVARILQAAGAAVIPALAMIIPVRFFHLRTVVTLWELLQSGLLLDQHLVPLLLDSSRVL